MGESTFGAWLTTKRTDRGMTLRDVERISGGRISNAYLSQLETGRIKSPSVLLMHVLSAALALDFAEVCERACVGSGPPLSPPLCPTCGQLMRAPNE